MSRGVMLQAWLAMSVETGALSAVVAAAGEASAGYAIREWRCLTPIGEPFPAKLAADVAVEHVRLND